MTQHPTTPQRKVVTPLEHMLGVLNDPTAAPNRKDRMAIAAAPYCHPRIAEVGKKAQQTEAARTAGGDDVWGDDLQVGGGLRQ